MRTLEIPNYGKVTIENVLFDMNGTIQFNGRISKKIVKGIRALKNYYTVVLISADTRGNLNEIANKLGVKSIKISTTEILEAEAKNNELINLGKDTTVAIGNGNNDSLMLHNALIGIAVVGAEGATSQTLMNSDVVFTNCNDAIHFLMDDKKIIATLRS